MQSLNSCMEKTISYKDYIDYLEQQILAENKYEANVLLDDSVLGLPLEFCDI